MDTSKIDVELPHVSHPTETGLQEITRRIIAAAKPVKVTCLARRRGGWLGNQVDLLIPGLPIPQKIKIVRNCAE
jgi:hypothetical protein